MAKEVQKTQDAAADDAALQVHTALTKIEEEVASFQQDKLNDPNVSREDLVRVMNW